MINLIKLIFTKIFGGNNERLDGATLFAGEYGSQREFSVIPTLYKNPIVRIPCRYEEISVFKRAMKALSALSIQRIALLDQFDSHKRMMSRLQFIKEELSQIRYIQLFNELPHMTYPGEQIYTLQQLIELTNQYTDWIHQNIPDVKVITMAPYNSIDHREFPIWGGASNTRILKDLILYTTADIAAVHMYGNSLSKQLQMMTLADNIREWNDEAQYKKKIWITEIGVDGWKEHAPYYHHMVRLAVNVIKPEKTIWYRQTIASMSAFDAEFALECRHGHKHSPLWDELKG